MHITTRRFNVTVWLTAALLVVLSGGSFTTNLRAASLGAGGYTNSFSALPSAADWSTFSIAGGAGDFTAPGAMDTAVQLFAASSANAQLTSDAASPPAFLANGTWSSSGLYVQTRPTGNAATLVMATFINTLGQNAATVTLSYDYVQAAVLAEEVDGHRVYYSTNGLPGSWTPIPSLSSPPQGRPSTTLSFLWNAAATLYVIWVDDNAGASPDTAMQIDNFSATVTPAAHIPVSITSDPQSISVNELSPASFTVAAGGNPTPTIQWYSNNVAIPGATSATYAIGSAPLHYNGLQFKAVAQNVASNVTYMATSAVATLTVIADTNRPTLVSVVSAGLNAVAATFSEPVRIDTATNLANYLITNNAGNVLAIQSAQLAIDQTNVTLITATQALGGHYTLVLNGIRDVSAAANEILSNTLGNFVTADFTPSDIGNPSLPGGIIAAGGGYNVTGAGADFGGTGDQFTMAYQQKAGDFDVMVRVDTLGFTDPWAKAALMARESLNSNSVFAASVATPLLVGCFFESRATTGGSSVKAGSFPANYPEMWLRLRRAGNAFSGYASADGKTWLQLGTVNLALGPVYLGFAVTSHNPAQTTTANFRGYIEVGTNAQVVSSMQFSTEPLSAAERTGPIVISEIMYRPAGTNSVYSPGVTNSLEFIELYNSNPYYEDIGGYRLSGDIDFTFPSNTIVPAGTFLVVAKDPVALQNAYGISGVMGPYSNSLPANGTIRLRSDIDAILLTVDYSDDNPWPVGADGTGHSLVLARPSYGQNDPHSWDVSDRVGGSPGRSEPMHVQAGLRAVVINEILAHTDPPLFDYIELYNYSTQPVDISGCYLSDAASTNKFRVPTNTVLPPRGFISFSETNLGFALDHSGEKIFLRGPDGSNMLDAVQYEAQENGVAFGRYPDGSPEFYRLSALTPGTNNASFLVNNVVINELMYGPISEELDDQYIELYNKGASPVDISGWRFTSGIDFKFPPGTIIPVDGYVVAARNRAHLLSHYDNLNAGNTFGNFDGRLSRDGERVALARPEIDVRTNGGGQAITNTLYIVVDEVTYKGGGRWGEWANQGGSSLELVDPRSNHRLAQNWGDSDETAKAPWTPFEHSGILDTGISQDGLINRLEIIMLGEGECLLDDVTVRYTTNLVGNFLTNPGFESGLTPWVPQGNHINSTLENTGYSGTRSLHIRTSGNGDTGANRIRSALTASLPAGAVCTIKGHVRWLRGWPEITLRLKGGFLEAYGRMALPNNLGTPGARNSRALTNSGPAIHSVAHWPVLPQVGDSVVVTAGAQDPDGFGGVTLLWRVDSATPPAFSALAMNDSGTNGDAISGDGIFSATIPPQPSGTMVSFYVEARDAFNVTNQFPINAIVPAVDLQRRECLVRWGDPMPVSTFATYRLWMSRANVNAYMARPGLSNEDVDGTMVVGNRRAIYNAKSHYSNSPYHQGQNANPESGTTGQHFSMHLPLDDKYLGTENFNKVHAPGNASFEDNNWMREQTAFWIARKGRIPYLYRRFVAMYVNGTRKAGGNAGPDALMEDTQRPGGELVDQYFPDENQGRLYKLQPWFEFDDVTVTGGGGAAFLNQRWCTMMPNLSTNAHKIARYRQNYLTRSADKTANDYTNVMALIDASNATNSPGYWQNLSSMIDIDQWTRTFAVEHAVGNWDSFGNRNAQNMYGYKPNGGKWKLMIWDFNIVLNNAAGSGGAGPGTTSDMPIGTGAPNPNTQFSPVGNLFQTQSDQDTIGMKALNVVPAFRRAWWRAYKELTVGPNAPMLAVNCDPLIDAKYNAIRASGLTPAANPTSIKGFISVARQNIATAVAAADVNGFTVSTPSVTASASNLVTISGTATFDITDIELNGISWPINWTSATAWSITIPVTSNTQVSVVALDPNRNVIGNTNSVAVTYAAAPPPTDPRGFIVFNEIMYNPAPVSPDAEYIELYNLHTNFAFNVSGWEINGLNYTFPEGTYFPPRSYIVLAKDRVAFTMAYGAGITVLDQYTGKLQGDGETLTLIRPAASSNEVDLVVDKIRYENVAPWPTNANGTGSSVQLIDPNQENARVGNWDSRWVAPEFCCGLSTPPTTNDGWRFVSGTGNFGTGSGGGQMRLMIFLGQELGTALIDDIWVVSGTNAAVGTNFVRNGDFELPFYEDPLLTNSWQPGTNYTNSQIVSDLTHSGSGALKLAPTSFGNVLQIVSGVSTNNRVIYQALSPAPAANTTGTLSFWYWATNSSTNLNIRIINSPQGGVNLSNNINITITPSNYVPPILVSPGSNYVSPGAANHFLANLPPFPPLWINEVQAENVTGITDGLGEHEPWVEIYNTSTNTVSLEGLFLAPNYTNLTNWAFPPGSSIGPTQFLVVFCDGQEGQTTGSEYHTSFRLPAASGSIALSRLYTNAPQVLDYVNYAGLHSDRSYGSFPDGQPFDRMEFFYVTPRGTNDGRSAPITVFVNEWLASNVGLLTDPADNDFDDWFELYNPTTNTVNLAGYYLTDTPTNKTKFLITTNMAHTIPPHGYLLVWADNETGQNLSAGVPRPDMHVNFQLARGGEAIGLYAADGSAIDLVTFGFQDDDETEGRYPDGSAYITAMPGTASPRAANYLNVSENTPPILNPIGDKVIYLGQTLSFTATASDNDLPAQILTYSLDAGAPAEASIGLGTGAFTWTPAGTGTNTFNVRVTDNGAPPASDFETIVVEVLPAPSFASSLRDGDNLVLTWDTRAGKKYAVDYTADLNPPIVWTPLGTNTATGNSLSFTNTTTNAVQGFFQIRTVE